MREEEEEEEERMCALDRVSDPLALCFREGFAADSLPTLATESPESLDVFGMRFQGTNLVQNPCFSLDLELERRGTEREATDRREKKSGAEK